RFVDPKDEKDDKKGTGKPPRITIIPSGNRLIVTSDDPDALEAAQALVRIITTAPATGEEFEVIRLKNAHATDAARVLDEAFNGPRQQPGMDGMVGRGRGGFPGGGFPGGPAAFFPQFALPGTQLPTPRQDRIRVVADTGNNSLLVKASPLDLLTIR